MVNAHKLGLAVGCFASLVHLVWSLLVLTGLAQPLVNFIFRMHFVFPAHTIATFNWGTALSLVVIASVIGYIAGNVLGMIWNKINK